MERATNEAATFKGDRPFWIGCCPSSAASIRVVATSNIGNTLEPEIHLYQAEHIRTFGPQVANRVQAIFPPVTTKLMCFHLDSGATNRSLRSVPIEPTSEPS